MEWTHLLCPDAPGRRRSAQASRTHFQVDFDRIVFSSAFRRLHDKTQVFPLPENDHVHSRLTHSLEVSCVGRSLATEVGRVLIARHPALKTESDADRLGARDVGDIVAAACLAHDIGNPPFGHAGEDAIGSWFKNHRELLHALTDQELQDVENFEGNAQGFRIITRSEGFRLTFATLAAFTKYPREAGPRTDTDISGKKHGFFQAEQDVFERVATETGLHARDRVDAQGRTIRGWCRHPLAFLVEAADDICYSILDLEDGYQLGLVTYDEVVERFAPLAKHVPDSFKRAIENESIGHMRAIAINQLVTEAKAAFLDNEVSLLAGNFEVDLKAVMPSGEALGQITALALEKCYRARSVVEIELAGYEAIHTLLSAFVPAALAESPSRLQKSRLRLVDGFSPDDPPYERILGITDYLSGMTDSYALTLFRRLKGMEMHRLR